MRENEADPNVIVVLAEVNNRDEDSDVKDKEQVVIPIDPVDQTNERYVQVRN